MFTLVIHQFLNCFVILLPLFVVTVYFIFRCEATLDVKIKFETVSGTTFWRTNYDMFLNSHPCVLKLNWKHNHKQNTAEYLGNLKINRKTVELYYKLFETHSPSAAFHRHQMELIATEGF